jgi:hypothetical protein
MPITEAQGMPKNVVEELAEHQGQATMELRLAA